MEIIQKGILYAKKGVKRSDASRLLFSRPHDSQHVTFRAPEATKLRAKHIDIGIIEDVVNVCGFALKMTNILM
jgi:hypothetical protein